MIIYPFTAPIILTDDIFTSYGGATGTSTVAQRQAAYLIAEKQTSQYIGTLLLPVSVTGTYNYQNQPRIATDYGYVQSIDAVTVWSQNYFTATCDLISNPGCAIVADDTYGYIDIQTLLPTATLISYYTIPYPAFPPVFPFLANYMQPFQFQVAYHAGLPTGTANQPDVLLALTMIAQIQVNLMSNQSALAGEADMGIDEFSTIDYREVRHKSSIRNTVFGSSPMALRAALLLRSSIKIARQQLQL